MLSQASAGTPNAYESKLTVLAMLLFPEMITGANRPRLLELAGKTDAYWRPRLERRDSIPWRRFQKSGRVL